MRSILGSGAVVVREAVVFGGVAEPVELRGPRGDAGGFRSAALKNVAAAALEVIAVRNLA